MRTSTYNWAGDFSINMRKKIFQISLIVTLFTVGILLVLYPKWDDERVRKQQLSLVAEWDSIQQAYSSATKYGDNKALGHTAYISVNEKLANHDHVRDRLEHPSEKQEEIDAVDIVDNEPMFEPMAYHGELMIGKLTIESIEVEQPILSRATEYALNLGIGNVLEDRNPIDSANFVLAGHRGRSYGRLLNRLHELEQGDTISLETMYGTFEYEISDSFLVTPDDLSVLDEQEDVKELTLITCHPVRNPTHRLIVKATLKSWG